MLKSFTLKAQIYFEVPSADDAHDKLDETVRDLAHSGGHVRDQESHEWGFKFRLAKELKKINENATLRFMLPVVSDAALRLLRSNCIAANGVGAKSLCHSVELFGSC